MSSQPRRLGQYELQKRLAHGGMGEVWKALDSQLQRIVAIKLLRADWQDDPDFVERFTREAQFIASLHHPNIMQIHNFEIAYPPEVEAPIAYMVMDYVQGETIAEFIRHTSRKGVFPAAKDIVYIFTGTSLALDYAHKRGMVHRDIKPANILLDQRPPLINPLGKPVLIDFGIARLQGANTGTAVGSLLGTPLYISPEQARGQHGDHRSDLYSLGIILYEMTTGVTPFRGDTTMAILMQHIHDIPTPPALINPHIPPELSEVILKGIAKHPDDRFQSAAELTVALAEALRVPIPRQLLASGSEQANKTTPVVRSANPVSLSPLSLTPSNSQWQPLVGTDHGTGASPDPITPAEDVQRARGFSSATAGQLDQAYSSNFVPQPQPQGAPTAPPQVAPAGKSTGKRRSVLLIALAVLLVVVLGAAGAVFFLIRPPAKVNQPVGPTLVGQIAFMNSGQVGTGNYDEVQIDLKNLPAPPAGKAYYAWVYLNTAEQGNPHWQLVPHNGVVHTGPLKAPGYTNLLRPNTILLITIEDDNGDPMVASPDLSKHLYYATLDTTHQPPTFTIQPCPPANQSHVCV